jgi:hypothetical protein
MGVHTFLGKKFWGVHTFSTKKESAASAVIFFPAAIFRTL